MSDGWAAVQDARERSSVLGNAAVELLREHPDPASWAEGPAACAFLRLGGNPAEWEGFRALLLAEHGCRRTAEGADAGSSVSRLAVPHPSDPAAYARSVHEWFAARGEWAYGSGCAYAARRPASVPVCEDPEGFLRHGWDCTACSYRNSLFVPDEPVVRDMEVA
jgi:hypothetical protein